MDLKLSLIIIMMSLFIGTGILEVIAVFMYQISINKTSYEDNVCILTIFKSIIHILDGIYFWCIFHLKKENIYWKTLKFVNIIIYIIQFAFFSNIKEYGNNIFIINIIAIEISLCVITMLIIFLIVINIDQLNFNKELVFDIPQIAVYPVNIELEKNDLPQATIVLFNYGTLRN